MLFKILGDQEYVIEQLIRQPVLAIALNACRRRMEPGHDRGP